VNFALVKSKKRVLKSTTILGCDVSEEDNVNSFFPSGILDVFDRRTRGSHSRTLDIKFSQVFAVFSAQSSNTYDNKDDLNNEPSTSEMSRAENP
jgi:hypothetical protein